MIQKLFQKPETDAKSQLFVSSYMDDYNVYTTSKETANMSIIIHSMGIMLVNFHWFSQTKNSVE